MIKKRVTNRRKLIVEKATELILQCGYAGTSIRQIADAANCTESALYYYFKGGKRELLQEIVENEVPKFDKIETNCSECDSLKELIRCIGNVLKEDGRAGLERNRWLMAEIHQLSADERAIAQNQLIHMHELLVKLFTPFVAPAKREAMAWIMASTIMGYGHVFWNMMLEDRVEFSVDEFIDQFAELMAGASKKDG